MVIITTYTPTQTYADELGRSATLEVFAVAGGYVFVVAGAQDENYGPWQNSAGCPFEKPEDALVAALVFPGYPEVAPYEVQSVQGSALN